MARHQPIELRIEVVVGVVEGFFVQFIGDQLWVGEAIGKDGCGTSCHRLDDGDAEDALKYYRDFYKIVDEPDEFEKKIIRDCRSMVTG